MKRIIQTKKIATALGGEAGGFNPNYTYRVRGTCPGNLIAYWPLSETTGATIADESGNGRTGSYNNVTLAGAGIGDGRTGASWSNTTCGLGDLYSTSLRDAINFREGSIMVWSKIPDVGTYSDNVVRRMLTLSASGAGNGILIFKGGTASNMAMQYVANGTTTALNGEVNSSSTQWVPYAVTYSRSASRVRFYTQGIQRNTGTSMGDFTNGPLDNDTAVLAKVGTSDSTNNGWTGLLAHIALWTTELTAGQIKFLSTV